MFDIEGKVALITGGASGIGLSYAKELLRNGLKGATLADVNEEFGRQALNEIAEEFGTGRAIFMKTDISDKTQFEEAFKATIATFNNLDILINNAGIMDESIWEKEISININGTINGILLALDSYLKYRSGPEAVILNVSSVAGLIGYGGFPIYAATKHAIIGLSRAWGAKAHYERTKTKVLAVCPGVTTTAMIDYLNNDKKLLSPDYKPIILKEMESFILQTPDVLAKGVMEIIKVGETGSVWVAENGLPPYKIFVNYLDDNNVSVKW